MLQLSPTTAPLRLFIVSGGGGGRGDTEFDAHNDDAAVLPTPLTLAGDVSGGVTADVTALQCVGDACSGLMTTSGDLNERGDKLLVSLGVVGVFAFRGDVPLSSSGGGGFLSPSALLGLLPVLLRLFSSFVFSC